MADPVASAQTSATPPAVAGRFRLAAPANWFTLDLDRRTYRDNIEALIQQRLGSGPDHERARRDLFALMERFTSDAIDQGAVQAFLLSDQIGERPLAASLICTVTSTPDTPVIEDVAAGLRSASRRGGHSEIKIVELGDALAVRARGRRKAALPDASAPTVEVETMQYFVAVPGRDALLILSFSTPDLALAEPYAELFDAMASSLTWEA